MCRRSACHVVISNILWAEMLNLHLPVQTDIEALPSMEQLLGRHVKLKSVKKIGEGTFGEAFKSGNVVFKIVPMEGSMLVIPHAAVRLVRNSLVR
jgi:hypothetical protein